MTANTESGAELELHVVLAVPLPLGYHLMTKRWVGFEPTLDANTVQVESEFQFGRPPHRTLPVVVGGRCSFLLWIQPGKLCETSCVGVDLK
jgi:hypothetical protein